MPTTNTARPAARRRGGRLPVMNRTPIGRLMKLLEMNDRQFADLIGCDSAFTIRNWRLGIKAPRRDRMRRIAEKAGTVLQRRITIGQLTGDEPLETNLPA